MSNFERGQLTANLEPIRFREMQREGWNFAEWEDLFDPAKKPEVHVDPKAPTIALLRGFDAKTKSALFGVIVETWFVAEGQSPYQMVFRPVHAAAFADCLHEAMAYENVGKSVVFESDGLHSTFIVMPSTNKLRIHCDGRDFHYGRACVKVIIRQLRRCAGSAFTRLAKMI